ncbi:MAG: beta-CASP ribonuclease aCPSF1 [Candidatus Thermoplasmatota archaeon]|nr:beta-CASP ribonuclease aCPSF1 [Candidatus Thermoplasmatota archaeon]
MSSRDYLSEIREIFDRLYQDNKISEVDYEGPNIVVYTKSTDLFSKREDLAIQIAQEIKRRVIIRPDPSILSDEDKAKEEILKIVPENAGVQDIYFESDTGEVVIEADEPSIITDRNANFITIIKSETNWSPRLVRAPPMYSRTVKEVRELLREVKQERRAFLHELGEKLNIAPMPGETWIRISALGGHREVGRSSTLVSTNNSKILVDCGMLNSTDYDQPWSEAPYLYAPEVQPFSSIDAVVLTHAHLDHSGILPVLFKFGYEGPVYMTAPTRDLAVLLQNDFIKVAHAEGRKAAYESKHIREMVKRTIVLRYNETTDITRDTRLTLYNAGHILGSASVHLHIGEGLYNIVLSGDVKFEKSWLFNPANNRFPRVETFMTESTYAGRDDYQHTRKEAGEILVDIVNRTFDRGGSVLIPVFAVGRSQEVMLVLEQMVREGRIKLTTPVYLDGMIMEATAIHAAYPEFLNKELKERIMVKNDNPFLSKIFKKVETKEERQNLCDSEESKIVLATSGMMNGGPVMEYFRAWVDNPKHTLVFVGYQADGTMGRKIQKGAKEITLSESGKATKFNVSINVETAEGFSGHSDKRQLMAYIATMQPKPRLILVNHGDGEKAVEFAKQIKSRFGIEAHALRDLETIRLV